MPRVCALLPSKHITIVSGSMIGQSQALLIVGPFSKEFLKHSIAEVYKRLNIYSCYVAFTLLHYSPMLRLMNANHRLRRVVVPVETS